MAIQLTKELRDYLLSVSLREPAILRELREETASLRGAGMQIAPEQGQFMAWLVRLIDARRCLEVGVFTGYSSLITALTLPDDGYLVACDRSREWTDIAKRYWERAGVAGKIDLRLAPALETLQALRKEKPAPFDFAFIDADKTGYADYFEACLALLRPGGIIAVDNTLWHGRVIDTADTDEDTEAIRAFNESLHRDERIDLSLLPLTDGMTLCRKRE
jgi:predicted O-methyltransferase YrrM